MRPDLSICIPTYNRAPFLRQTVERVLDQIVPGVEIVISDNASTDGTQATVEALSAANDAIRYVRHPTNLGLDRNFLSVIEQARGRYSWFLGDDDMLAPGGLQTILNEIESGHAIYLCNRSDHGLEMEFIRPFYWLDPAIGTSSYDLAQRAELIDYLASARSVGALFSFLSSVGFDTDRWKATPADPRFIGSWYAHAQVLISMIAGSESCPLRYLSEPLIQGRVENARIHADDLARRMTIDFDGYLAIFRHAFGEDAELLRLLLGVLRHEFGALGLRDFAYIKALSPDSSWRALSPKLRDVFDGPAALRLVNWTPRVVLRLLRVLKGCAGR